MPASQGSGPSPAASSASSHPGADHSLGAEGDGVGVPDHRIVQLRLDPSGRDGGGGRGDGGAVAGEDAFEHLGGGELVAEAGQGDLVRVGGGGEHDVGVVLACGRG